MRLFSCAARNLQRGRGDPSYGCSLREQKNTYSWVACIALGHDASNDPVEGGKIKPMNEPPDAHEQQIIRSWNGNDKPWTQAIRTGSMN